MTGSWRGFVRRRLVAALMIGTIVTGGVTAQSRQAWAPTPVEYAVMAELVILTVFVAQGFDPGVSSSAMSCPVFGGSGTVLGEDRCAWAKATGAWTTQSGNATSATLLRIGGQAEIAPDWFLGGALGLGSGWSQNGTGVDGTAQIYDGSIALKHTMGPWLFAGALAFSSTAMHLSPQSALLSGGALQGDATSYNAGLRLRAAYDFDFTGFYLRPRLDLDLLQSWRPGFMLSGPNVLGSGQGGLAVDSTAKTSFIATPMLELGGRYDLDGNVVLRPYVAAGASFLPDNSSTVSASFTGPLAAAGVFQSTTTGPTMLANIEAGLQLYKKGGFEAKAEYTLAVGDNYLSQTASVRGAYHF